MNIFVTNPDPHVSAKVLPDKHVVKMPLETCQMLSIVFSHWYYDWGDDLVKKKDGTPYKTSKGAFSSHPCTIWANESLTNTWWLLKHGLALCAEYTHRYGKVHSCQKTLEEAESIIPFSVPTTPTHFTRAMPDEYKHDTSIDTFTAYKNYISSKPWASSNYLRDPSRKPNWI